MNTLQGGLTLQRTRQTKAREVMIYPTFIEGHVLLYFQFHPQLYVDINKLICAFPFFHTIFKDFCKKFIQTQ